MVISFTGAQSTGKSTLLEKCKQHFGEKFSYVDEVTRLIKREYNVPINESGGDVTQILIMNQHLINSLKYKSDVIMDRCCIDGFLYTLWLQERGNVSDITALYSAFIFEMLVRKLNIVFFCAADFPLVADGTRSQDVDFRERINEEAEEFCSSLREFSPETRVVFLTGSLEDRFAKVIKTIEDYKNEQH